MYEPTWFENLASIIITWDTILNVEVQVLQQKLWFYCSGGGGGGTWVSACLTHFLDASQTMFWVTALGSTIYEKWQVIRSVDTKKCACSLLSFAKQS